MGKRGVLAAAFLAMAVGLAGADDEPVAPANSIDCTLNTVGNPPTAGRFEGEGSFGGFAVGWVTEAEVKIYKVTIDGSGNEVLTYANITYKKTWTSGQSSGSISFGNSGGPLLQSGDYRAILTIGSQYNTAPQNAITVKMSRKITVP